MPSARILRKNLERQSKACLSQSKIGEVMRPKIVVFLNLIASRIPPGQGW